MWFDARTMSAFEPIPKPESPSEIKRAALATAILIALFAVLAFAPPFKHDATKVIAGVPCSVLSEEDISAVLGEPMRLMPTSGTVCQYVATGAGTSRALFVVARHDASPPLEMTQGSVAVPGLGDSALRTANALYVRYGSRSYTFDIVPQSPNAAPPFAAELRLAKMMHRDMVARR
jgi:hypothetical protein